MKYGCAGLIFAVLASPAAAFARPSARLQVERAEEADTCPSAESIGRTVAERLGYRAVRSDADAEISVAFARADGRKFTAKVTQRDEHGAVVGERHLDDDGPDCVDLGEAVVLTVSVLLESPALVARRVDGAPSKAGGTRDAPDAVPAAPPEREQAELRARLRAEGTASFAMAPAPSLGATLGAGVQRGTWSLDIEGRADLAAEDISAAGRVRTSLRLLNVVPCKHVGVVAACAVAGAGVLTMEGIGVANARADARFHAVGGLRLAIEPPLGRGVFLSAHADALLAFTRTTVAVGSSDVWTVPPVAGSVSAGLGYAFW